MNIKYVVFVAALGVLVGCSSVPVSPSAARDVPPEQAMAYQTPIAGGGTVTVVRDGGFGTSPCLAGVFVGGKLAAKVGREERVKLHLPAGRNVIAAHLVGDGLCGIKFQERGERATAVQIAAGDAFTYRIASPGNGEMTITPLN